MTFFSDKWPIFSAASNCGPLLPGLLATQASRIPRDYLLFTINQKQNYPASTIFIIIVRGTILWLLVFTKLYEIKRHGSLLYSDVTLL